LISSGLDKPLPNNSTKRNHISRLLTTVLEAGSWHNHYPGDPRISLDLTRLVSFYDTELVPSLVPFRQAQTRYEHRLEGITPSDALAVRESIASALIREETGSGIDWKSLFRVITLRYADRLELIHHLLNTTEAEMALRSPSQSAKLVQQQLRTALTPYILNNTVPSPLVLQSHSAARNLSWTTLVYKYCATSHTDFINSNPALFSRLTPSEVLLLHALRETNGEICRVVVKMWAEGVKAGLDPILLQPSLPTLDSARSESLLKNWRTEIDGLIDWLDWSIWIKCRPACGFEVCSLLQYHTSTFTR